MRSCKKCFEYVYVFVGGDVRMCPWNGIVIGNLIENTLEEIWHGKKAEEVRQAFMKGELIGCSEVYCPNCINNSPTLEITEKELKESYENLPDIPQYISLAYDERCNHICPSCRSCFFTPDEEYRTNLKKISDNIEPYLPKVKRILTNGIGDLFVSSEILDMISRFHPVRADFSMFIETNGVLFKKNWSKLQHLAGEDITISVTPNSFDRETYRYLAGKDHLKQFEESLTFITELKHRGAISRIRIIMVIQDSNFRQIPQFIQKCIDYDADDIVLRPIFKWFGLQEDELLYKNVLNPCHPYHKEYLEIIEDPICKDPRVFNWGFDVEQEAIEFPTLEMERQFYSMNIIEKEKVLSCHNQLRSIFAEKGENKQLIIYGLGKVGKAVLEVLTSGKNTMPVKGFAVTEKNCETPNYWMGYPVCTLEEWVNEEESQEKYVFLVATTNLCFKMEMKENLENMKINNYMTMDC